MTAEMLLISADVQPHKDCTHHTQCLSQRVRSSRMEHVAITVCVRMIMFANVCPHSVTY